MLYLLTYSHEVCKWRSVTKRRVAISLMSFSVWVSTRYCRKLRYSSISHNDALTWNCVQDESMQDNLLDRTELREKQLSYHIVLGVSWLGTVVVDGVSQCVQSGLNQQSQLSEGLALLSRRSAGDSVQHQKQQSILDNWREPHVSVRCGLLESLSFFLGALTRWDGGQ